MRRGGVTSEQWERPRPLLPPPQPKTGRLAHDHRRILGVLRTGAPGRDVPDRDGPRQPVAARC